MDIEEPNYPRTIMVMMNVTYLESSTISPRMSSRNQREISKGYDNKYRKQEEMSCPEEASLPFTRSRSEEGFIVERGYTLATLGNFL